MSKKLKSKSPLDAAACSGFFIVNDFDRPDEERIAGKGPDGRFYYVHPKLRDEKRYHGMTPTNPTPVEAFGLMVDVKAGVLIGVVDDTASVGATYRDGRPRRWQGSRVFSFSIQNRGAQATRRRRRIETMKTHEEPQRQAAQPGGLPAATGYAGDPPIPATVGYNLAMLGLQSQRYKKDAEYRDAVDAVLAWVKAARRHTTKIGNG